MEKVAKHRDLSGILFLNLIRFKNNYFYILAFWKTCLIDHKCSKSDITFDASVPDVQSFLCQHCHAVPEFHLSRLTLVTSGKTTQYAYSSLLSTKPTDDGKTHSEATCHSAPNLFHLDARSGCWRCWRRTPLSLRTPRQTWPQNGARILLHQIASAGCETSPPTRLRWLWNQPTNKASLAVKPNLFSGC